jgi:HD-like signal output (HDOD) protein
MAFLFSDCAARRSSYAQGGGATLICVKPTGYALIPPCPAILTKLLRETRAEEPDFRRIGQFIGGDVALTPGEPVLEIENERYTMNHARIGAHLARSWHLSESLCYAILHHHDVPYSDEMLAQAEDGALSLVAIGLAAEQLYCSAIGAVCHEWTLAGEWALSELDVTREKLGDIAARVKASINHL